MQDQVSPSGTISKQERDWAMIAHLSALIFLVSVIGGMLAPLIIWMLRKDDMAFAADQAKEALNFQITCFLLGIVCWVLMLVIVGFLLLAILCVVDVVLSIVAAMKVSEGKVYRYPFNFRLIR